MSEFDPEAVPDNSNLLTPKEAAVLLRVSASWLAKARMRKEGPRFVAIGRCRRYRRAALLRWLKSQER
jgi:excisionase family DNA binding protein